MTAIEQGAEPVGRGLDGNRHGTKRPEARVAPGWGTFLRWTRAFAWLAAAWIAPGTAPAQPFEITSIGLLPDNRVRIGYDPAPGFYQILQRGEAVDNIGGVVALRLSGGAEDAFEDALALSGSARRFYRIRFIPLGNPLDVDGDGMDDVYELERPGLLDPRNSADASADPDGNGLSHLEEYRLATEAPVTFTSSPLHGEGGVAVTRETILRFSDRLGETSMIGQESVFAEFGGNRLPARIHVGPDRRTVTLFYASPLPAKARIRVSVAGDLLVDELGRAVDGDGDGEPGGIGEVEFDTLSLTVIEGTAVCGRVFASELVRAPEGDMSVNRPLADVRITVDGMEETLFAVTDAMGDFRLEPAPVGRFFVHIDGRPASADAEPGAYYPFVGKAWESVAGVEVNIGEVFLPLVLDGTLREVSDTEETTIFMAPDVLTAFPEFADVHITVPPGALFNDDGSAGRMVGIAPVPPDRLPGPLPETLNFPVVITVQTDGATNFDIPAPVCFPNLPDPVTGRRLPSGSVSALWSFNHDTGRFEVVGPMTVSDDGLLVCTDPGVGILAPGWHATGPGGTGRGGPTRTCDPAPRPNPRPTAPQECAKDDCACEGTCSKGRSVYLHSGEEVFTRVDLRIPGRARMDFVMTRTYRSRLAYDGPMGYGWNFTYNEGLWIQDNGDVVRYNGRSHEGRWVRQVDGTFTAPPGYFSVLRRQDDGTYTLTESDGFRRCYRANGRLLCHIDRFGNRMSFEHDARGNLHRVIDVYGRAIEFNFGEFADGVDRLTRVRDFFGREVRYEYDARGDLVRAVSPAVVGTSTGNDFPSGRAETYTYSFGFAEPDLNHNLMSVTAPVETSFGGSPRLRWIYGTDPSDPATFDRVLSESEGGVNASGIEAGGTMTFEYEMLNQDEPPGQPDLPRGKATVTERNGNVMEYFVNESQLHILTREFTRGLREGEPEFFETRSHYDADGQLIRRVFPLGNEIRYTHDSTGPRRAQGNVVEVRQIADPDRGGGPDLVTRYTYEPLFQQVASVTDPRGQAPGFTPPIGEADAARYTTRILFDYQESQQPVPLADALGIDLGGVPRGLGDLNDDGRTDQVFGNVVRVEHPTVRLEPLPDGTPVEQPVVEQMQWNGHGQVTGVIDPAGNTTAFEYHPENDPDGDGQSTFSLFTPLSTEPVGYLGAMIVDAAVSPRRDPEAPAPAVLTSRYTYDPVGHAIGVIDPRGVHHTVEINALDEIVSITRGAAVDLAAASGQLITGEPAFGYRIRYHYDANGRVVRYEEENREGFAEGVGEFVEHSFEYDILDNRIAHHMEVDANTRLTRRYRYDPNELLVRIVHPEGNVDAMVHDERNLSFTTTRGAGTAAASTMRFDYDANGNVRRVVDAEDNDGDGQPEAWTWSYDGFDRTIAMIDPLGNSRLTDFDPASNTVRTRVVGHPPGQPDGSPTLLEESLYHHDELNRVFRADQSLFLADGFNPVRETVLSDGDGDGRVSTGFAYDAAGRLRSMTEDDGQITRYRYDGADRLIETVDAAGNSVTTDFDANSNPIRVVTREVAGDGAVAEEVFTQLRVFDQLNRLVRDTDNAGQTTRYQHDSRDNVVAVSDAQGPALVDPLGLYPDRAVDPRGIATINGPGNRSLMRFDGLDRLVQQTHELRVGGSGAGQLDLTNATNPDGLVTVTYAWDGNSRLAAMTDDLGQTTRVEYDALDRRTAVVYQDNTRYTYLYDRDHNLVRQTDPNGTVAVREFDGLHRLTQARFERAAGVEGSTRVTFEYDGLSRTTRSTDDNGSAERVQETRRIYDSLSRVIEEVQNGRATGAHLSGDGKRLAALYPGGRRVDQTYDAIDRLTRQSDERGMLAQYTRIGPGTRELTRALGNGVDMSLLNDAGTAAAGYDADRRMTHQRWLAPNGSSLVDRQYGYNRFSQRLFEQREDDGGRSDRYQYDSLYRLTGSDFDSGGSDGDERRSLASVQYNLDGVGNRRDTLATDLDGLSEIIPYTPNVMNEYAAVGGIARQHSPNGNLTGDGSRTFHYDAHNRLVAIRRANDGALIAEYGYDTFHRRRHRAVYNPDRPTDAPAETFYFYAGNEVCEEQNTEGATLITYVHGMAMDDLVHGLRSDAHPLGAGEFYSHQNVRGDVVAVTDASGDLVEKRLYDDFGATYDAAGLPDSSSAAGNPYGFQGRRIDPESGLYYFRNRYYDPATGRFLQRDPVWDPLNAGNAYSFAGNGPVTRRDPMGLKTVERSSGPPLHSRTDEPSGNLRDVTRSVPYQTVRSAAQLFGRRDYSTAVQQGLEGARYVKAEMYLKFAETHAENFNDYASVAKSYKEFRGAAGAVHGVDPGDYHALAKANKLPPASHNPYDSAKNLKKAQRLEKLAKGAKVAGRALQVVEVGSIIVDQYRKDERVKKLAANERDRILDEYQRLSNAALALTRNAKCKSVAEQKRLSRLRDKLLRDARENMEFQLNNVTEGQVTEHLINGAVAVRDALATYIPLPTGWLWGNQK